MSFEFAFFHYVGGYSWTDLLANYNLLNGCVWIAELVWIAIAPMHSSGLAVQADSPTKMHPAVSRKPASR